MNPQNFKWRQFFFNSNDEISSCLHSCQALCFAVSKENLAYAYANRSAICFQYKKYKECLQNIQWARENDYPADKAQKLIEREEKCKSHLKAQEEDEEAVKNFLQLSYPANPKIPFIVDCLEMRANGKFGRGIFTTRDLKAGDIIAIEEPVLFTMSSMY